MARRQIKIKEAGKIVSSYIDSDLHGRLQRAKGWITKYHFLWTGEFLTEMAFFREMVNTGAMIIEEHDEFPLIIDGEYKGWISPKLAKDKYMIGRNKLYKYYKHNFVRKLKLEEKLPENVILRYWPKKNIVHRSGNKYVARIVKPVPKAKLRVDMVELYLAFAYLAYELTYLKLKGKQSCN